MNLLRRCMTAFFVSGTLLACSGNVAPSGGASVPNADAFFNEFCSAFSPCCAQVGKSTDGASCKQRFALSTADSEYDPVKGQVCINEIRAQQNNVDFCTNPGSSSKACEGTFREKGSGVGTKEPGEECSKDGDCAPSSEGSVRCESAYRNGSVVGMGCQLRIEGGREGDGPCLGTKKGLTTMYESAIASSDGRTLPPARGYLCDVADGVYCSRDTSCRKLQNIGETCDTVSQYACVSSAYCDFSSKTCVAKVPVGGNCASTWEACTESGYCDTTTSKCVARFSDGTACSRSDECISNLCLDHKCSPQSALVPQFLCGSLK